jgi:hypothetical protein
MFSLADFAEVKRLLEAVAVVEEGLTPNELELYRSLKAKYDDPGAGSFDDKTCLEVILRNIEIRKGYRLVPGDTAGRVIDMPRVGRDGPGSSEPET